MESFSEERSCSCLSVLARQPDRILSTAYAGWIGSVGSGSSGRGSQVRYVCSLVRLLGGVRPVAGYAAPSIAGQYHAFDALVYLRVTRIGFAHDMLPFSVCASLFLDVEDVAEGCFGSVEAVRESFLVLGRYIGIRRVQCVFELVVQPCQIFSDALVHPHVVHIGQCSSPFPPVSTLCRPCRTGRACCCRPRGW